MIDKRVYPFSVEPQNVDFTLHATAASICTAMLNTAGVDAHLHGFGVDTLTQDNMSWVLSRMAVEIEALPPQYTSYNVSTWVNEAGRMLTTRNFEATAADGTCYARGVTQWCLIDFTNRRPVALDVIEQMQACMTAAPSPCAAPRKLRPVEATRTVQHRVAYSDIDFNRHMNTMRYVDLMMDMLPIERLADHTPLRLDVHFLHESCFGQVLTVGCRDTATGTLFEICRDDAASACLASVEWRPQK